MDTSIYLLPGGDGNEIKVLYRSDHIFGPHSNVY